MDQFFFLMLFSSWSSIAEITQAIVGLIPFMLTWLISDVEDDLLSKLNELDDPENQPKKKEKESDEEEDTSGMDDILGKLDEL